MTERKMTSYLLELKEVFGITVGSNSSSIICKYSSGIVKTVAELKKIREDFTNYKRNLKAKYKNVEKKCESGYSSPSIGSYISESSSKKKKNAFFNGE